MSWSFHAVGKPAAVAKAMRAAAENGGKPYCSEPEETIRKATLESMALAAEAQGNATLVRVSGHGSQWKDGDTVRSNTVKMEVEPITGFIE